MTCHSSTRPIRCCARCNFTIGNVRPTATGFELHIRKSKTDQAGKGGEHFVDHIAEPVHPYDPAQTGVADSCHDRRDIACPACALRKWLDYCARLGHTGWLFPSVVGHLVRTTPFEVGTASYMLERAWRAAGLPAGQRISTRSLRVGDIGTMAEASADIDEIQQVSRHESLAMASVYLRWGDPFEKQFHLPL